MRGNKGWKKPEKVRAINEIVWPLIYNELEPKSKHRMGSVLFEETTDIWQIFQNLWKMPDHKVKKPYTTQIG